MSVSVLGAATAIGGDSCIVGFAVFVPVDDSPDGSNRVAMPPRESKMQISYKGETIWHGCWGQVMKIHGRSVMDVVHWPEVFDAVCFPVNLDDAYLNDFAFEIEGDVHLPFEVVLALAARPDEKPSAWITVDARPTRGPS